MNGLLKQWRLWRREAPLRYHSRVGQLWLSWKNRSLPWRALTLENLKSRKRSDTLFILGSGPSLNQLTPEQWKEIGRHDSLGINYSILADFVPTYYYFEDGKKPFARRFYADRVASRRARYAETVYLLHDKHLRRLIHPRYTPELFAANPQVVYMRLPPKFIEMTENRPFRAEDFAQTLIYRSSMSVALDIAARLDYSSVVLLGVDLQTHQYFFENDPEMRPYVEGVGREDVKHVPVLFSQVPVPTKQRPFADYLAAAQQFVFAPRGHSLYVASSESTLAGELPVYSWKVENRYELV